MSAVCPHLAGKEVTERRTKAMRKQDKRTSLLQGRVEKTEWSSVKHRQNLLCGSKAPTPLFGKEP